VKLFLTIIANFYLTTVAQSQNLILNGSFETYSTCPDDFNRVNYAQGWYSPTPSLAEYYHSCAIASHVRVPQNVFGFEQAKTGNAYMGIITWHPTTQNIREYLQTQLTIPLIAGRKYYVSFYVSLPDSMAFACNSIGAYISSNAISKNSPDTISVNPQVKNPLSRSLSNKIGWTLISDTIVSTGGERYITIGNFLSNMQSDTMSVGSGAHREVVCYYVDDIQVLPIESKCLPRIFPNPIQNTATLQICTPFINATIILYNSLGQTIRIMRNISGQTYIFDRSNLPAGTYFIRVVEGDKDIQTNKILIMD
jgi:hypothetical protein